MIKHLPILAPIAFSLITSIAQAESAPTGPKGGEAEKPKTGSASNLPAVPSLLNDEGLTLPRGFQKEINNRKMELPGVNDSIVTSLEKLRAKVSSLSHEHQYEEADEVYAKIVELIETNLGRGSREAVVQINDRAQLLLGQGRGDRAEVLLRPALEAAIKNDGEGSYNALEIMESLAMACTKQSKFDEAIKLQQRNLQGLSKLLGRNSAKTAYSISTLAHIYSTANREKSGEPYAREAVSIFEQLKLTSTEEYATALNNLGSTMLGLKRYAEAELAFRKSYEVSLKLHGEDAPEMRSIVNNLAVAIDSVADIQDDKKRKDEAEEMYRRSLAIAEKQFGPDHPMVAVRLGNIAGSLMDRGKFKEAETMLRRAVKIEDTKLPRTAPQRSNTRMKLVRVIQLLGRVTEAETYAQETLTEAEAASGPESAVVADVLHSLGRLQAGLNRAAEAEYTFWRAFEIREKVLGPDDKDVAESLNNVALLVQARGDYKNPESMFRRVIKINSKHFGENDFRVAEDVLNLANNLQLQKRWNEAETEVRRAMKMFEITFGKDHHMMGSSMQRLAHLQHEQKKFAEEEATLRKALEVLQNSLGERHPRTSDAMVQLAVVLHKNEKLSEAEKFAREGYLILRSLPEGRRPDDTTMSSMLNIYIIITRDLGASPSQEYDRIDKMRNGIDPGAPMKPRT